VISSTEEMWRLWQMWQRKVYKSSGGCGNCGKLGVQRRIKPVPSVGVKYLPEPELTTGARLFISRAEELLKFRDTSCSQRNTGGEGESRC